MGAPATEQLPLTLVQTTSMNRGDVNLSQAEAAKRYTEWQSHHQAKTGWQKIEDGLRSYLPDWAIPTLIIVGAITLGLVVIKVVPIFEPIKKVILWLLKFWESFLEKTNNFIGKK